MTPLIELHYLPSISYFALLARANEVIIERHEHFEKQTLRNRCQILTSQGEVTLSIPLSGKSSKVIITDIKIDYTQKWLNNHWRTLQSAYRNAPFYEYYADDLEAALFKKHTFLYDLNWQILSMCLRWLKWNMPIRETNSYEKVQAEEVLDCRSAFSAKKTDFLNSVYQPQPYTQVFGSTFAENLSIIDLIFCEGPGASRIVQASALKK